MLDALKHFDDKRYVLHAAVVMPNRVHAVVTLQEDQSLEKITHSWKSFTAHEAVKRYGHAHPFWQRESYDHIVRDDLEFGRIVRYVLDNPRKASLPEWPFVYERLSNAGGTPTPR